MDGARIGRWLLGAGLALGLGLGCGRDDFPQENSRNTEIGPTDFLLTIGTGQMSTNLATVLPGARVTVINRDNYAHQVVSDRTTSGQATCPELDGPVISSGGSFTFVMGNRAQVCGFHDLLPNGAPSGATSATLAPTQVVGTIIVTAVPAGSTGSTGGTTGASGVH